MPNIFWIGLVDQVNNYKGNQTRKVLGIFGVLLNIQSSIQHKGADKSISQLLLNDSRTGHQITGDTTQRTGKRNILNTCGKK